MTKNKHDKGKVIAVDLDGCLAQYDQWKGYDVIGEPIEPMMALVKKWTKEGKIVKIFTARIHNHAKAKRYVEEWLEKHGMGGLEVTNIKEAGMSEFWDDRAVAVKKNTGEFFRW